MAVSLKLIFSKGACTHIMTLSTALHGLQLVKSGEIVNLREPIQIEI